MRLSQERKTELYNAISDPIMDDRVKIRMYGSPPSEMLDSIYFNLEREIWRRVCKALDIQGPA